MHLKEKTNFYSGVALNPFSPNLDKELKKMDAKIKGLSGGVHFMPFGWFGQLRQVLADE